jgi:hypothetical protein
LPSEEAYKTIVKFCLKKQKKIQVPERKRNNTLNESASLLFLLCSNKKSFKKPSEAAKTII